MLGVRLTFQDLYRAIEKSIAPRPVHPAIVIELFEMGAAGFEKRPRTQSRSEDSKATGQEGECYKTRKQDGVRMGLSWGTGGAFAGRLFRALLLDQLQFFLQR